MMFASNFVRHHSSFEVVVSQPMHVEAVRCFLGLIFREDKAATVELFDAPLEVVCCVRLHIEQFVLGQWSEETVFFV